MLCDGKYVVEKRVKFEKEQPCLSKPTVLWKPCSAKLLYEDVFPVGSREYAQAYVDVHEALKM
jgi:hypothetical protein